MSKVTQGSRRNRTDKKLIKKRQWMGGQATKKIVIKRKFAEQVIETYKRQKNVKKVIILINKTEGHCEGRNREYNKIYRQYVLVYGTCLLKRLDKVGKNKFHQPSNMVTGEYFDCVK